MTDLHVRAIITALRGLILTLSTIVAEMEATVQPQRKRQQTFMGKRIKEVQGGRDSQGI
jgi:hypothetical protein